MAIIFLEKVRIIRHNISVISGNFSTVTIFSIDSIGMREVLASIVIMFEITTAVFWFFIVRISGGAAAPSHPSLGYATLNRVAQKGGFLGNLFFWTI